MIYSTLRSGETELDISKVKRDITSAGSSSARRKMQPLEASSFTGLPILGIIIRTSTYLKTGGKTEFPLSQRC